MDFKLLFVSQVLPSCPDHWRPGVAALPTTAGHAFPAAGARLALPVWTQYCLSRKLMTSLGLTEPRASQLCRFRTDPCTA